MFGLEGANLKGGDPWRERSQKCPFFFFGIAAKSAEQNVGHIFGAPEKYQLDFLNMSGFLSRKKRQEVTSRKPFLLWVFWMVSDE